MRLLATLREGKAAQFPACCRWRFAIEELLTAGQSEQCLDRGVRFTTIGALYVPCAIVHKATLTHAEWERDCKLHGIHGW
ncbi:MAG TPA: hypothetical protein VFD90_10065 [Gaiellales bacterium]|nr:hypothetical protein [Gaiellales bacterium]